MNIAIIDADLVGRKKHRFPNLACMKLSGYYKELGNKINLIIDYRDLFSSYTELKNNIKPNFKFFILDDTSNKGYTRYYKEEDMIYDKIIISKVFTDTPIPKQLLILDNVEYGGTGFFYDKAEPLQYEIEHHMPDYHLYDDWVSEQLNKGRPRKEFEYYLDYSIGFTTRGCFRKCSFCVNQHYCDMQKKNTKFYVFCGFDRNDKWDLEFWKQDIIDTFERVKILMKYGCLPYIMRHERYKVSPYYGTYINLASWCNQPSFFKKTSYREYGKVNQERTKTKECATMKYLKQLETDYPDIASKYFDMKFEERNMY